MHFDACIRICAKEAIETKASLISLVEKLFTNEKIRVGEDAVIASARQNASLLSALEFTELAVSAFADGTYADAASSEIERALGAISEIDGREVCERVLSDIFSKFCVGK